MFLTNEELEALTGRTRKDAQLRALRFMRIEHRLRPDGSVVVTRGHVDEVFGNHSKSLSASGREPEINWDNLNRGQK